MYRTATYTLQSTTNTQHKVGEDCYGDNTIWTGLRITGSTVQEIGPPFIPEDRLPFVRANVTAIQAGGRWKVAEGSHWMLDTGTSQGEAQRAVKIINHYNLASLCFVGRPRCGDVSPMMYWLNEQGRAPTGQLPGEDGIGFDRSNLTVVEIGDRWKVVDGAHWLLDFGPGQGNAVAALHFIRKYRFDEICFVGWPDPSMTYFTTHGRRKVRIEAVDPRRIEAAIDLPTWWSEQADLALVESPWLDLGEECAGTGPNPRDYGGFVIEVRGEETTEIVERHGLTGLAVGRAAEIRLAEPSEVVDIGIAQFGEPPTVTAYAGKKAITELSPDAVQRQIENVRLIGTGVERITIDSPDGECIVNYIRSQPRARRRKAPRKR